MRTKISVILLAVVLAFSSMQIIGAETLNTDADIAPLAIGEMVPLTQAQIEKTWPKLPSAKQLFENEGCLFIDLRYCGKQVSSMDESLPDPNSKAVIDMTKMIVNCTTTTLDTMRGGVIYNAPQIWLQYDSNIWVQVPSNYLNTATTPTGSGNRATTTWAIGMYANPQAITGSHDVWGVCTFGQFNSATFGSSNTDYVGTVLTVNSNNYGYQEGMVITPTGRRINYNIWDPKTNTLKYSGSTAVTATTGQMYNLYIRYNTTPYTGWQMWWNQVLMWTFNFDSSTRVKTGDQANVVIESTSFNSTDFKGFSTNVGGTQSGIPLCAATYLFNGNWQPSATGHAAPAGYTYLGGQVVGGMAIGNQGPPNSWGSLNIGQTSSLRERFTVGAGLTQRNHGYTLWTAGNV